MLSRELPFKWICKTFLFIGVVYSLVSCQIVFPLHPSLDLCQKIEEISISPLTAEDESVIFEKPGTIIMMHGSGCAQSNSGGVVMVEQSVEIPQYANKAIVFLNGWKVNYLRKDHNVFSLGTAIGKIKHANGKLTWNAIGVLSDKDGKEAHNWCYRYTVVAWNDAMINAVFDQDDANDFCKAGTGTSDNFYVAFNKDMTTALSSYSSFIQNANFSQGSEVAVLPRGFGLFFSGNDHNLLQAAYNLDHSETFIEQGKIFRKAFEAIPAPLPTSASRVNSGFVSWDTYSIFKDNDTKQKYTFFEIVSGIGGKDVGIIQPPFSILPAEDHRSCSVPPVQPGIRTEEFVIENIPFEFAVPVLTGWDLLCPDDDENVTEIGIWIDEWSYNANGGSGGTLRYKLSSVLRDKDSKPKHCYRHKVAVLGLKPTAGGPVMSNGPDLVPFSPSGNLPDAYCRLDANQRELHVTVKNQGNEVAVASKTTVTFGNIPVTVDTPTIPAGGSAELTFKVPSNCFKPNCSFIITVDSANQVNEFQNEGNNNANGNCPG